MPPTRRFIAALTESLLPIDTVPLSEADRRQVLSETSAFVQGQVDALPRRLALMFDLGTTVFRLYVRLRRLRGFCDLPAADRREIAESWAYGRIALFRALFKLIRTTALLAFFESPPVLAALEGSADRRNVPQQGAA